MNWKWISENWWFWIFLAFELHYIVSHWKSEKKDIIEAKKIKRANRAVARKLKKIEARLQNIESSTYSVEEAIYNEVDELKEQTKEKK